MGKRPKAFLTRSQAGHPTTFNAKLNRWLSAALMATMMAVSTIVVAAELPQSSPDHYSKPSQYSHPSPSESIQISQRIRRPDIWQEVQKQLPDLPLENQYINSVTGEVSESNTLVQRMIEYHNFRKGRSPRSRFDWKLTLADYLGINEVMVIETYPGTGKLNTNPIEGDRAAIRAMDRQQRQQLVNTLVSLYNPRIPAAFFDPAPVSVETAPDVEVPAQTVPDVGIPSRPSLPPLPEPGAADLLRPRT